MEPTATVAGPYYSPQPLDNAGPFERAWRAAGYGTIIDKRRWKVVLLAPEGVIPVLSLPAALLCDDAARERCYAEAMAELVYGRVGFAGLVAALRQYEAFVVWPAT